MEGMQVGINGLMTFENPDSSWYFHRKDSQNEGNKKDGVPLFDTEYRDLAVSIMEQAREKYCIRDFPFS